MENLSPSVFIVYHSSERRSAEIVSKRLHKAGIETWLDRIDLAPVDTWNEAMATALAKSRVCLIFFGSQASYKDLLHEPHSLRENETRNREVRGEIRENSFLRNTALINAIEQRLQQRNISVIPVLLPGVQRNELPALPAFIEERQWIQFYKSLDDDSTFRQFMDAVLKGINSYPDITETLNAADHPDTAPFTMHVEPLKPKTVKLPDIDWVKIPAGAFSYGEQSEEQTINLDRFYISRYAITNAQFQCFIDAGGYDDNPWWQDLKKPQPAESSWKQPNRPRETVDWFEAVAFTRWLSAQLKVEISLPTEQQWEKAARSTDGRVYPWGNDFQWGFANVFDNSSREDNLLETTAVGLYPLGNSPYGVADMAGNVWEWCLNQFEKPDIVKIDSTGANHVVRGGSWHNHPEDARSAFRYWINPVNRDLNVGFRVVSSSPSLITESLISEASNTHLK